MFVELSKTQIKKKLGFIQNYINSKNNADASRLDANSNVDTKNVAALRAEINKDIDIQIGRALVSQYMEQEDAEAYEEYLTNHLVYCHDESYPYAPYCNAVTLYPLLLEGTTTLGSPADAPKHLTSYNGNVVNAVYLISGMTSGATGIPEWLVFFDAFARKDYGDNYLETHTRLIKQEFQQTVYAINQKLGRSNQSPFSNISIYDKYFFAEVFKDMYLPDATFTKSDGTKIELDYTSYNRLQQFFMKWFNKEREKKVLTFPVVTANLINDGTTYKDKEFADFLCTELSEGNSFFIFTDTNASAVSACCRIRLETTEADKTFSFSTGAGGVQSGSLRVITMNLPMLTKYPLTIEELTEKTCKFLLGHRDLLVTFKDYGLLPIYDAGFMHLNKQFVTVGVNGMLEYAELLGYDPEVDLNSYKNFVTECLTKIRTTIDKKVQETGVKINFEFTPCENLGVKNAKWCKEAGIETKRDCHNSYMFPVESEVLSILDNIELHGTGVSDILNGGQACHINLETYPTKEAYSKLLDVFVVSGCNYFTTNILVTKCNNCGYINKQTRQHCTACQSTDVDHCTRVIGYLRPISSFSSKRQEEAVKRKYHSAKVVC